MKNQVVRISNVHRNRLRKLATEDKRGLGAEVEQLIDDEWGRRAPTSDSTGRERSLTREAV